MYCRSCGHPMNENQVICLECGVRTGTGDSFCPNCGSQVDPKATVCMSCGVALRGINSVKVGNKMNQDKLIMILICLFLGEFGIHNFIMGETKKGIFKLIATFFLCGTGWIFALVDLIKIAMDTYVIDPDKLI